MLGGGAFILLPGASSLNTVLGRGGEDIHYTARGVHTKHTAAKGGRTNIILSGACTLNTMLGEGDDIYYTARGVHIKHNAG